MLRAVLFDIDGTLIDSNDLHAQAWGEVFRQYGVDLTHQCIRDQIGKGGDNLMPALLPPELIERHGHALEEQRKALFKRDYLPKVQPFPGVKALFEGLKASGASIVLATSAGEEELESHKRTLGIADLIDGATSADDVEHSKPCPDIFQAALAKLPGVAVHEVIVVGDTPYDMEAARSAGMARVAVLCGGFVPADLFGAGAMALFDGPWSLAPPLDSWLDRGEASRLPA